MNLTTSPLNTPETNQACKPREMLRVPTGIRRMRGLLTAAALCALSLSIAGCGDGLSSSTTPAPGNGASSVAAPANSAAPGAGGASAAVPIVAMPASGACAASGASATQPVPNTQLICAP